MRDEPNLYRVTTCRKCERRFKDYTGESFCSRKCEDAYWLEAEDNFEDEEREEN